MIEIDNLKTKLQTAESSLQQMVNSINQANLKVQQLAGAVDLLRELIKEAESKKESENAPN